jgi:hypothetical protein
MPRYRKKPLARLERGSRIYAPSPGEPPVPGGRRRLAPGWADLRHVLHGEAARAKARALDGFTGQSVPVREPHDAGRRTVERLAAHYVEDHLWGPVAALSGETDLRAGTPRLGARIVTAEPPPTPLRGSPPSGPPAPFPDMVSTIKLLMWTGQLLGRGWSSESRPSAEA